MLTVTHPVAKTILQVPRCMKNKLPAMLLTVLSGAVWCAAMPHSQAADIAFAGKGGDPHRQACLMVRQSLDANSAYADAALHGDGLASLQYRAAKNERTYEIQSGVSGPKRLRIEKRGRYVTRGQTSIPSRLFALHF